MFESAIIWPSTCGGACCLVWLFRRGQRVHVPHPPANRSHLEARGVLRSTIRRPLISFPLPRRCATRACAMRSSTSGRELRSSYASTARVARRARGWKIGRGEVVEARSILRILIRPTRAMPGRLMTESRLRPVHHSHGHIRVSLSRRRSRLKLITRAELISRPVPCPTTNRSGPRGLNARFAFACISYYARRVRKYFIKTS